ncbi:MAG: hypothetical protein JWR50_4296 [Mucilaginibacter sp.]|nr:hypothetical protein [Mucilaginibacter sp.]
MFNLPAIPTDSLYKFLFVGGLILIISAFTFSDRQFSSLKNDRPHQKIDSIDFVINQTNESHASKARFISSTIQDLKSNDSTVTKQGSYLPKLFFLYSDSLNNHSKFSEKFGILKNFEYQDATMNRFIVAHLSEIRNSISDLALYEDNIFAPEIADLQKGKSLYEQKNQELINSLKIFNVYIYTSGALGIIFAVLGVIMWYFKLQRPQDENQAMQLEQLKEAVFIQKINAQLDTEIKTLQLEQLRRSNQIGS